jgi:hypothetical protein
MVVTRDVGGKKSVPSTSKEARDDSWSTISSRDKYLI